MSKYKQKLRSQQRKTEALQKGLSHLPKVETKAAPGQRPHPNMLIAAIGIRRTKTTKKGTVKVKWYVSGKAIIVPTLKQLKVDQDYSITIKKEVKLRSGKNKGDKVLQDAINNLPGKRYKPRTEQIIAQGDVVPKKKGDR
jgi:hypothetical protein